MSRSRIRALALGLGIGLALLVGGRAWHRHAPLLSALPARLGGSPLALGPGPADADVTLFVSGEAIAASAAAGTFDALDLSWGWAATLAQEVGPFRVRDLSQGVPAVADATPLAIWTRSAGAATDGSSAAALAALVEGGALVVLDRPGPSLYPLAGFRPGTAPPHEAAPASGLSAAPDGPLGPAEAAALARLDVPFRLLTGEPSPDAEVVLRSGNRPAALRRRVGAGTVVTLLFDCARLVTSLQQGIPAPDLGVANRYPGRLAARVESNDLVASASLLDNDVPYADLLERLVLGLVEEVRPLPAWWGYPGGAAGAFLMTHDDEGFGNRARRMTRHDAEIDVVSTTFFLPSEGLTPDGLAAMRKDGTEAGIHWNRTGGNGARDDIYLGPLRVLRVERSLTKQVTWLRILLPDRVPVRASRVHLLAWGPTWAETFRELAAASIAIDSTYGVDPGSRGYLFGTGRPFRPLDEQGLPLPLLEIPHLVSEDPGGFDAGYLRGLLDASRASYHQAITVRARSDATAGKPSVAAYHQWRGAYELAREMDHRLMTAGGTADFEAARAGSSLRSEWDGGVLWVTGSPSRGDLSLVLPREAAGRTLAAVRGPGGPLALRETHRMGRAAVLLPAAPGPLEVEAVYRERSP